VAKNSGPVQRVDRQAVVTLPQHIDVPHTGQIREELVATAHIVRRVLSLNGLDRLIPIYPPGSDERHRNDRCTA
jgi:hypothetical protein